jgi:hypothetical protein
MWNSVINLSTTTGWANVARPLFFVFRPRLLSALAPEHANRAATQTVQHRSDERGLLAASTAQPDEARLVAAEYLVLELGTHKDARN